MKKILFALLLAIPAFINADQFTPQDAIKKLLEGNTRFANDKNECFQRTSIRRLELESKQKPFAVIVGCSDSRVPPEILFDQGLGDLFVIRNAGNVVTDVALNSIEYSVMVNGSVLVMVLGHENCGAVSAVLHNKAGGIPAIEQFIEPAIKKQNIASDDVEKAIKANVLHAVQVIRAEKNFQDLIQSGKLSIVGAYYRFSDGKVELVE